MPSVTRRSGSHVSYTNANNGDTMPLVDVVILDCSSGVFTVNLPEPVLGGVIHIYWKESGNSVTVAGPIYGDETDTISANCCTGVTLVGDGTYWQYVSYWAD